ncbi:MAG: hypothetical protein J0H86_24375 [Xanthomonadaceae bacterium]|nr:hypothetical protein [Xanthomonadaceae bacterium]
MSKPRSRQPRSSVPMHNEIGSNPIDSAIAKAVAQMAVVNTGPDEIDINESVAEVVAFSDAEIEALQKSADIRESAIRVFKAAARDFVRDTYSVAILIAKRDEGERLVTQHHALQAIRLLSRRDQQSPLGQIALAVGGLLTGLGADKAWEALTGTGKIEAAALYMLLIGVAVLVFGIISTFPSKR